MLLDNSNIFKIMTWKYLNLLNIYHKNLQQSVKTHLSGMKYSLERRLMKLPRERFQPIYSYSKKIQFNLNANPDISFSRLEAFTSDVLKLHIILYQIDCTQHAQVVIIWTIGWGSKSDINTFSTLMSNRSIVV